MIVSLWGKLLDHKKPNNTGIPGGCAGYGATGYALDMEPSAAMISLAVG